MVKRLSFTFWNRAGGSWLRGLLWCGLSVMVCGGEADAQDRLVPPIKLDPAVFRDTEFQKRFSGDFAPVVEVEPKLSPEEGELFAKVGPLLESAPAQALAQLQAGLGETSSATLHFIVGHLLRAEGRTSEAEREYKRAIEKFPRFLRANKHLGVLYAQEGKYGESLPYLQKAIELGEGGGDIYGLLGQCYKEGGNMLAAESAYRQAYLLQPGSQVWKLNLIDTMAGIGRWQEANAMLEPMIHESPSNPTYWMLQANCYLGMDQPLKAANNLEVVRRMGGVDQAILNRLGRIYLATDQPGAALSAYSEALEGAGPVDVEAALGVARLLSRQGAYAESARYLDRLAARTGSRIDAAQRQELQTLQAQAAGFQGRTDDAIQLLERVVQAGVNGEARVELGKLYANKALDTEDEEEKRTYLAQAERHFEVAQQIPGSEADAYLRHGQALVRVYEFEKAVTLLEKSLQLQPNDKVKEYFLRVERAAQRQQKAREREEGQVQGMADAH